MVTGADQTETTGWGAEAETLVPTYPNRSARLRGYAFCGSDNAGLPPRSTTKTGVDMDSPVYRATRQEMITVMRPVIDFLNKLSREVEAHEDETPLQDAIADSKPAPLRDLRAVAVFAAPQPTAAYRARARKDPVISYRRPIEQIRIAQKHLGVYTQREVGERTFDYYFKMECAE